MHSRRNIPAVRVLRLDAQFFEHRLRLVLATALLLLFCSSLLRGEAWTLEKALSTALAQNPDAKVARHRVEGANALLEQAGSAWMPQVMLQSRYTTTNNSMAAFGSILNQRAFSFSQDFNHPGRIDDLNATGTIAYNLYSGGRASAGRQAARSGVEAAEMDLKAAQNQLSSEVVKAYLGIRKAREAVQAVEAGVKAYEAAVAVAKLRYEAGNLLKADLLSLEVQLAQTRESYSSVSRGAQLAARAFLFVLGQENSGEAVELAEQDSSLDKLVSPANFDFSQRPELLGLEKRIQAADSMVRAARGSRQPTVNAFVSYQYDRGWKLDKHADGYLGGVSLDLNVFDGGQTSGKIRQSLAELAQVKELQRKARLGIGLEVEQARLSYEDARERLAVSAKTVEQAEESASLSRARFEKGAILMAELIGVEGRLIEARMRRALAHWDERIALADLRRSLGLTPLSN